MLLTQSIDHLHAGVGLRHCGLHVFCSTGVLAALMCSSEERKVSDLKKSKTSFFKNVLHNLALGVGWGEAQHKVSDLSPGQDENSNCWTQFAVLLCK